MAAIVYPAPLVPGHTLDVGRPIVFEAETGHWVVPADETGPQEQVTPANAPPHLPRYLFSVDFHVTSAGLVDGAPLVPLEDLSRLRDPPRYRWAPVYQAHLAKGRLPPYTKARAISRVLSIHRIGLLRRVMGHALCGHPGEYSAVPVEPIAVYRGPCGLCPADKMVLSTCCPRAIEQPLPSFPNDPTRRAFHDPPFDPALSDFTNAWAELDQGHSDFISSHFHYPVTCRHSLSMIGDANGLRTLMLSVLDGPGELLELVGGYLGRQLWSCVVAPLFSRTCAIHPSGLDFMDRTGPWRSFRPVPSGLELVDASRRLLTVRWGYFHYVLTPVLLKQHAKVKSFAQVVDSLARSLRIAGDALSRPPVTAMDHFRDHRETREFWALLWRCFADFPALVRQTQADLAMHDADVMAAPWCLFTLPVMEHALDALICRASPSTVTPLLIYDDDLDTVDDEPITRWFSVITLCNMTVFNRTFRLSDFHPPLEDIGDLCGPSCWAGEYDSRVARWTSWVSARSPPPHGNKRRRSPRRFDYVDPDSTEEDIVYQTENDSESEEF